MLKSLFKIGFQDVFSDPAKSIIWVLVSASFCFCAAFIWTAVADGTGRVGELSLSSVLIHYFFLFLFWYVIGGMFSMLMGKAIYRGELSNELLRPVFPFAKYILWEQGWKAVNIFIVVPILIIFIIIFNQYLDFSISLFNLLITLPSLLIACCIFMLFDFCLGCLTFFTGQIEGVYNLLWPVRNIFGGWLVPVALLPDLLHKIAVLLPFRYFFNFPVELLQNQLEQKEIITGYLIAILWVIILFFLSRVLYKAGLKRYEAFGN